MKKADIGVYGLAVMGQNLVLNIESQGFDVSVYNRTKSTMTNFMEQRAKSKNISAFYSIEEFVHSLKPPRKIIMMVKAGAPVDKVIEALLPFLEEGDIILDGGNSHFHDTNRRYQQLSEKGINFLGTGISGGEYGALHGPSIMPGGSQDGYKKVEDILTSIAASTSHGPCVTYLGDKSAGHYVKMVHNGIEYAVMQAIAEVYDIMRKALNIDPSEISKIFAEWNQVHQSYLLEISSKIMDWKDEKTGKPIVNVILDRAKQKGTGKWSVQSALELGVPLPVIGAAVTSRNISALKEERMEIGEIYCNRAKGDLGEDIIPVLEDALYLAVVMAYAEGMNLLQAASKEYEYGLKLSEVARIWEDGCIIRSAFLQPIQKVYKNNTNLTHIMLSSEFKNDFIEKQRQLRDIVAKAKKVGIAVPVMAAALDYFDSLRSVELPANLIQAQRDYFGAHTYQRRDQDGTFHTEWQDIKNVD